MSEPKTTTRLYRVTTPKGVRLVEAASRHTAVSHVVKSEVTVDIPAPHEIHKLAMSGVPIELAGVEVIGDETRQAAAQSQITD